MNYGISCDPGSKNASLAVWCRRLKCGACTCNSTGKRHSRSWPESAIQNRTQRRRAADPAQHVPHRRFLVRSVLRRFAMQAPGLHRLTHRTGGLFVRHTGLYAKDCAALSCLAGVRTLCRRRSCREMVRRAFSPAKMRGAERETRDRLRRDAAIFYGTESAVCGTAQPFGRCGQHLEIRNDSQYAQNRYFGLYVACSGTFLRGFRGLHCAKASWRKAVSRRTRCCI